MSRMDFCWLAATVNDSRLVVTVDDRLIDRYGSSLVATVDDSPLWSWWRPPIFVELEVNWMHRLVPEGLGFRGKLDAQACA